MSRPAFTDPAATPGSSRSLDTAPPRPPGPSQSVLQMGREPMGQGMGLLGSDPSIQILQNLQESRNSLMKLAASLPPPHSDAIQQMVTAIMQAVPQMMADIVSGQVPNQGPVGGPGAMTPTAPPPAAAQSAGPAPAGP